MTDDTVEDRGSRPRTELAAGSYLGRYRLDAILGAGGMGVVWSARDPGLDRAVAIKVLQVRDATPAQRTRLLREARAMARLRHPNVLTVYEVDSTGGRDFIAMELVDGGSLDAWLATRPPRAEVMAALLAAGRGLAAAPRGARTRARSRSVAPVARHGRAARRNREGRAAAPRALARRDRHPGDRGRRHGEAAHEHRARAVRARR